MIGTGAQRVAIVGAGVGGLAAACLLAARGADVIVLERAASVGGKIRALEVAGQEIDSGPTVFTMRWVFEELFAAVGARFEDHLTIERLDVLARHGWRDGARLDLFADVERSADAIGQFAGAAEARGFLAFTREAARVYATLEGPFIRAQRPSPPELALAIGRAGISGLMNIQPFRSLWAEISRYFRDPRLRQLFGRYATYCGASPFSAPGTLMLVAHVEQAGVWSVKGGMIEVARALARMAERSGARIRTECHVEEVVVAGRRVMGVRLASGEVVPAPYVVFNGDAAALATGRLGAAVMRATDDTPRSERSQSAITWSMLAETDGFPLVRHNVLFSDDYPAEFAAVFRQGRPPQEPTTYVCAQDRDDRSEHTRSGPERLLCLVNAPANGDRGSPSPEEISQCETRMLDHLRRCGLNVRGAPQSTLVTTPHGFEGLFPATGGALYGRAPHGWAASFQRPGSRSRVPGLYLAGGSAHPGPGVPMAALSGMRAAEAVLSDWASTSRSVRVAMPGGTSTA